MSCISLLLNIQQRRIFMIEQLPLIPGNIWNICAAAKRRKIVLEENHASASSSRGEPRPSVEEFAQNRLEGFSSGGSAAFLPPSCEESLRGVERTLYPAPPRFPPRREIFQEDHRRRTLRSFGAGSHLISPRWRRDPYRGWCRLRRCWIVWRPERERERESGWWGRNKGEKEGAAAPFAGRYRKGSAVPRGSLWSTHIHVRAIARAHVHTRMHYFNVGSNACY